MQEFGAFFECFEGVVFGDDGGDDVEGAEHIHGLGLDDGHEHQYVARLEVFDGGLHGVKSRLIHEADKFHADDDHLGVVGDIFHHLFEFVDGAEEDGAVESLDVYVLAHLVGDAAFVVPREGFVEIGLTGVGEAFVEVGRGHGGGAVAALDEVAGTFHEQHTGDDHADTHGGEEVDKHGDEEDHDEHHGVGFRNLEEVFEAFEVDDAPADGDEDAGENGEGYVFYQAAQAEEYGEEQDSVHHAADLCASATLHVDNGTHGGTSTGKTAEKARNSIADALADKFFVGVVFGLGDIVGHHGGEERVDRAEACESEAGDEGCFEDGEPVDAAEFDACFCEEGHGKAGGDVADDEFAVEFAEERDDGHNDKSHKCCGHLVGEFGEVKDDEYGAEAEQEGFDGDALSNSVGDAHKEVDHAARAFESDEGVELLQDDDDTDTAHEAGKDGVGNIADVFAQLDDAEEDLEESAEETRQSHADEHGGDVALRTGPGTADEGGCHHGHGTCRAADLAVSAAEEGSEETEHGCTDKTCQSASRSGGGVVDAAKSLNTECQCEGKSDNASSYAAKNVAFDVVCLNEFHLMN